jgi:hypothetical protein
MKTSVKNQQCEVIRAISTRIKGAVIQGWNCERWSDLTGDEHEKPLRSQL